MVNNEKNKSSVRKKTAVMQKVEKMKKSLKLSGNKKKEHEIRTDIKKKDNLFLLSLPSK